MTCFFWGYSVSFLIWKAFRFPAGAKTLLHLPILFLFISHIYSLLPISRQVLPWLLGSSEEPATSSQEALSVETQMTVILQLLFSLWSDNILLPSYESSLKCIRSTKSGSLQGQNICQTYLQLHPYTWNVVSKIHSVRFSVCLAQIKGILTFDLKPVLHSPAMPCRRQGECGTVDGVGGKCELLHALPAAPAARHASVSGLGAV